MKDEHLEILLGIQKELSTNTEATNGINKRLDILNGKVATHSKQISKLKPFIIRNRINVCRKKT